MTQERELHPDLRAMLIANEPFEYAHLIKFERPSRPDSSTGKTSTASVRYTHLTDASRDIGFDDGSKNLDGISNGSQTYRANKVLKVSEVSESIEAKASNFSLTLDGNGLGAEIGAQGMTVVSLGNGAYDVTITDQNVDPIYEGFREGDKIEFYGGLTGSFNITNFRANNVVRISKIDDNLTEGSFQAGFRIASEEIKSILLNKNADDYSSFVNREVFIYKLYQQNGITVGAPLLLFKGIISNVSFNDGDTGITVQWGLTSHWGDFAQVRGRITSDDFHRALDQNGNPQPLSTLKPEYAYDKGFMHAETSVNMLAKYVVSVEKQDIRVKKGFLGIGSKVKVKKYNVNEDRFTQLDIQLAAKAIPLHYGVRTTEGFPVFADTLNNDSSTVFIIYALGEGPWRGLYDVIIDGKSLICNNKSDLDARGTQTSSDTVDLVCRGRADRGDVLGGTLSTDQGSQIDFYDAEPGAMLGSNFYSNPYYRTNYRPYVAPPLENDSFQGYTQAGKGIIDGESLSLTSPIDMTLDFFNGEEDQEGSSQLTALAQAKNFKIQNDYWKGTDTAEYWGPNHRLLDTAYVLAKFKISEGETSIPSLAFVGSCKVINCYNYDYSYTHFSKATTESPNDFSLGSYVSLRRSDNGASLGPSVQIIDKWTFVQKDGTLETRFRFDIPPELGYIDGVPAITKFYMEASGKTWTMTTFNYVEYETTLVINPVITVIPTADPAGLAVFPVPAPTDTYYPPIYSRSLTNERSLINGQYVTGSVRSRFMLEDWYAGGEIQ